MKTRMLMVCLVILLVVGCTPPAANQEEVDMETLDTFETELESLRQEMKIPGMSLQPEPGTMQGPGEFYQGVPADFSAIYRPHVVPTHDEGK